MVVNKIALIISVWGVHIYLGAMHLFRENRLRRPCIFFREFFAKKMHISGPYASINPKTFSKRCILSEICILIIKNRSKKMHICSLYASFSVKNLRKRCTRVITAFSPARHAKINPTHLSDSRKSGNSHSLSCFSQLPGATFRSEGGPYGPDQDRKSPERT